MTSIDDNSSPPDKRAETLPDSGAETLPAPPARKPLTNSWAFPVAGGLFGAYFLVSGALMVRDKHGDGVFALLMTAIVVVVGAIAALMLRSYRTERAARK